MRRPQRVIIVVSLALAFAAKLTLAIQTYGTTDVLTWEKEWDAISHWGAIALYPDGASIPAGGHKVQITFNHPPFIVRLLSIWGWLASVTGMPLRFWLRATSAVADLVSAVILWAMARRSRWGVRQSTLLIIIFSPVSLLISGFHGNTDPVMMALVLLSLYLLENGHDAWAAATFGMAMNIKIVPTLFLPSLLLFLGGRRALRFVAVAGAVFIIGSSPFLVRVPALVLRSVFGYGGYVGYWGVSILPAALRGGSHGWIFTLYSMSAEPLLLLLLVGLSIWMNKRNVPLFTQMGSIAFAFMALSPAFGPQYLAWLVPWTAAVSIGRATAFHAVTGVSLLIIYTHYAKGFPWYLANSMDISPSGATLLAGALCWCVVCVVLLAYKAQLLGDAAGRHPADDMSPSLTGGCSL
jgi:glycosyl transferase family 87